jgi:HK97 family phage major capsid protein
MNKKIQRLLARKSALVQAMRKLADTAEGEGRALNEEEQGSYDSHKAEIAAVDIQVSREQELQEFERAMIPEAGGETEGATSVVDPRQREADEQPWGSFGEFLVAVAGAALNPRNIDPRLVESTPERPSAITGLGGSVGSEGAFLVQTDFISTLLARTYDNTVILNGGEGYSGVSRIPLGPNSNGVKIPAVNETSRADGSRWGGVQAYWVEEGGTKTPSTPDFRQIQLSLKKLIGLCYSTDELLEDAMALEAVIQTAFSEEFAFKTQDGLINGTGAGQPLGILNSPCLVSVAKESGQTATTIVKKNIDKMYSRLWARGLGRAVWHINQDCQPQLYSLADAGNNAVYLPPGGMSARPYGTLLGRPVIPIEQCQTLGTKGDIYFCDWSEYIWIDKGNMQSASSIHVKFTTDETAFRFVFRCDGEPAWNSALTPYKGDNTLSPFVTLAVRS